VGAPQGALYEIDAGDLPAALGELDAPDPAARAEIQCRPVRWLASDLLTGEQFQRLGDERRIGGGILPGVETDRVGESPVHAAHQSLA